MSPESNERVQANRRIFDTFDTISKIRMYPKSKQLLQRILLTASAKMVSEANWRLWLSEADQHLEFILRKIEHGENDLSIVQQALSHLQMNRSSGADYFKDTQVEFSQYMVPSTLHMTMHSLSRRR